jgi:hypothetical protein
MPIATAPEKPIEFKSITRDHLELFEGDISYDLLKGGIAKNFKSTGIDDRAKNTMLVLEDWGTTLAGQLRVDSVEAKNLKVNSLTVDNFSVTGVLETNVLVKSYTIDSRDITVSAGAKTREVLHNSGVYWGTLGPRITFDRFRDKLVITGGIDLDSGSEITINGKQVLTETALGKNIKSSGLTKLGVLEELQVAGDTGVENLYANKIVIGLDTESHQAITATEDTISWGLGEHQSRLVLKIDQPKGIAIQQGDATVAVFDSDATSIESDLIVAENIKVEKDIVGKGNIGVAKNLYVGAGAKIDNQGAAQFTSVKIGANSVSWAPVKPEFGNFVQGDIVYNSEPAVGKPAGWICLQSGTPGIWATIGIAS